MEGTDVFYRPSFRDDPNDPLQQELNRLYDYSDDLETRILHRSRLNLFVRMMSELDRDGLLARRETALDIGCNAGGYSRIISDFGYRSVEGIDIEPELIARARARFEGERDGRTIRFRVENAEELDTSFERDFVLCTEVIEHTAHPEKVVANLRAVLAPGGIAVVTMPNAFSLPFLKAALKYRLQKRHDPVFEDHLRYPFWKALALLGGPPLERVRVSGTNLLFDATTLRWFHRAPFFEALNRAQFELARTWPLRYFSQFFFTVWRRTA